MSPTLGDLFAEAGADAGLPVTGLTADSRKVEPGFVFLAVPGNAADGRLFAAKAAAAGAVAMVAQGERPADLPGSVAYLSVPDARVALAAAATRLHPGQPGTVVAVTGTSGKSSVADFVRQIYGRLGRQAASLGTLGVITTSGAAYGSLTTPDPITLHGTLDRLARDGVTELAMEASSHGIEQSRLDGVRLTAAGFTNLGHDHLDYHGTPEAYLQAKLRLFTTLLPQDGTAVVNADGPQSQAVIVAVRDRGLRLVTTGRAGEGVRLVSARQEDFAQRLEIAVSGTTHTVDLPLVGTFQVENALLAAGLVLATPAGAGRESEVVAALGHLAGVSGRLERVATVRDALCIVDYAHKPDALANVLDALRAFTTGRLVCIVGCGGDRDRAKRPLMGRIAAEKADRVIVTDDNPRSEDPATIRAAILAAAPGAEEIGDRAEAIRSAVRDLRAGDVLLVAGKGHETGQIIGDRRLPFSDRDAVLSAIEETRA